MGLPQLGTLSRGCSYFKVLFTVLFVSWPAASGNCLNEEEFQVLCQNWGWPCRVEYWRGGLMCLSQKALPYACPHLIESVPFCPEVFLPTRSWRLLENSISWPVPHHIYTYTPRVTPLAGCPGCFSGESSHPVK